ncbi:MAG: tripartite tricarboxylate transporter substrate binding protein [Opitutaceae bacterium]|nr:tripartite tricarboxylate transporter substrate binding protein [Opitutaceae bacterium]
MNFEFNPKIAAPLAAVALIFLGVWQWKSISGNSIEEVYPARPIEIVVPYSAGGGTDTLARLVQRAIKRENLLDVPLVVVNQPGGSGTIGAREVMRSPADGYRILCLDEGLITSKLSRTVPFGPEAFVPIAQSTQNTTVIVVRADAPYEDLADLAAAAIAEPGVIRFGVPLGTPPHYFARQLQQAKEGVEFNIVQSMGGQKRYAFLMGGHIDVTIFSLAEALGFRAPEGTPPAEQIKALGILNAERHASLPDTPTAIESGLNTTAANALYWWAPKGTPPDRVALLADAIEQAMKSEQLQEEMAALSIDPLFRRGETLENWVDGRVETMRAVAFEQDESLPGFARYLIALLVLLAVAIWWSERSEHQSFTNPIPAADRQRAIRGGVILLVYVALLAWTPLAFAVATAAMVVGMGGTMAGWTFPRAASLLVLGTVLGCGIEGVFRTWLQLGLP